MKMSKNEINKQLNIVSSLINDGEFDDALNILNSLENQNPNNSYIQFNKVGLLIDIGYGLRDKKMIENAIGEGEYNLKGIKDKKYLAIMNYNLANGYLSLFNLIERNRIYAFAKSDNLQKSKSKFRDTVKIFNNYDNEFKKQVLVNYGNCLDTIGRTLEALYVYDKALKLDKNFSMAVGNRAQALAFFADISGEYRGAMYLEAYQELKSVINNEDIISIGGISAKKSFEGQLKEIESMFKDKSVLDKKIEHPEYDKLGLSKFEKFYIDFCVKEKLFLNFHIHKDNCESSIVDPIFISLIIDINDNKTFYRLSKYINQIKEDYAVARLLLVQSQYRIEELDSISKRTTLINTLDYSQFNLYVGLLKSAFKEACDILDKIAFFINDYFCLGLPERRIYFTSIWEKDNEIRIEILESDNISLYALYDIYKDIKSNYYKKIKDIRNAITHRKLVVYDSVLTNWDTKEDKVNIGYDTFLNESLNVFQLVKSAIIYLINFVNIEENKKRGNGLVAPMIADDSQFL